MERIQDALASPEIAPLRNRKGWFLRLMNSNATTVWSEDAIEILGFRGDELEGENLYDLMDENGIAIADEARRHLATKGRCKIIVQRPNQQNELVWTESHIGKAGKYFYFHTRLLPNQPTPTAGAFLLP